MLPPAASNASAVALLDETLIAEFARVDLVGGIYQIVETGGRIRPIYKRDYAPPIPGPTFRLNRGEAGGQLRIRLVNNLTQHPDLGTPAPDAFQNCLATPNGLHGYLTTNLHTHGLHVAPGTYTPGAHDHGASPTPAAAATVTATVTPTSAPTEEYPDNVFVALLPQNVPTPECGGHIWKHGQVQHAYEILHNHLPGTHWYHAHKHGSTNWQVGQGLFGALIVQEEESDLTLHDERGETYLSYIAHATEQVIFYTQERKWISQEGKDIAEHRIVVQPGEVQRWRVINASPLTSDHISFVFEYPDVELYLIAFDGIMLSRRLRVLPEHLCQQGDTACLADDMRDWARLAPGNRADFLVRVSENATPNSVRSLKTYAYNNTPPPQPDSQAILEIGDGAADGWSAQWLEDERLPGPGPALHDILAGEDIPQRELRFGREVAGTTTRWTLNEKLYGEATTFEDFTMVKDTLEEWTLINKTPVVHPFHIHVNPFFVTHYNGVKLGDDHPRRRWQDTIDIPAQQPGGQPGSITFRTKFADFTGQFVLHCHNLVHEDLGMMRFVQVIEPPVAQPVEPST
jgi:FtsP/CotA-like multicopper oxidase with cupredoxin domain